MNFYKRYPADYAKKTARLTLAQHGAYTLLLDEIYVSEKGLPAQFSELFRLCRALSKPEQEAVRSVVEMFFPISDDGMRRNERASEELLTAAPAVQAARENGKKGGRPQKVTQTEPSGLLGGNPVGNPVGFQTETQTEPSGETTRARFTQSSELREDRVQGTARKRATPPPDRPDDVAEQTWGDWTRLRKEKRASVSETVLAEAATQAQQAGVSLDRFLRSWCGAGWQGYTAKQYLERECATPRNGNHAEPDWVRERRERTQEAAPYAAVGRRPAKQIFDIEEFEDEKRILPPH